MEKNTSDLGKVTPTVTMRDVAKSAGVSVATVSHVVNNKPGARIGEATRQRVQNAVSRLGYRPNALAKTLSIGGSRFIGLVADAIATTPFAGQIIQGAQDEAWKHGYVVLVANTDGNRAAEDEVIAMMLEHQVQGILYSTWYHRAIQVPPLLQQTEAVLVHCYSTTGGYPSVVPDEEQGGRTATENLLQAGHKRIAFINSDSSSPAQTGRLAGYRAALASAGIEFDASLVFSTNPEQEGGFAVTSDVVESGVTAVFCYNDRVAMGLYEGLKEAGKQIPKDMAVIGFDNQDIISAHLRPPLSTVALPHYELGAVGVRLLLGIEAANPAQPTLVSCLPVLRESV